VSSPFASLQLGNKPIQLHVQGTMSETFPLEVTPTEAGFGFDISELPTGSHAVVADLGSGLRAVKVRGKDGGIEYAVTDAQLQPIYPVAKSVEELRTRFPR
jgi:hypothetical protein